MSLKIWTNARLTPSSLDALRQATTGRELVVSTPAAPIASTDFDIAFGQPDIAELLSPASKLKWAALTSAGYTRYDNDALRQSLSARGVALTTSSDVYADPCAQHILAF